MATSAEQVRSLIGLTELEVTNNNITTLLEVNGEVVKLAAADALEVYAGTLTAVTSDDISIDGSKRATVLMARAARLREQAAADADDEGFTFDIVDPVRSRPELTERGCW